MSKVMACLITLPVFETERSMSDLVNEAVQLSLTEDAEDLAAFKDRENESGLPYEGAVLDLKRRGKI